MQNVGDNTVLMANPFGLGMSDDQVLHLMEEFIITGTVTFGPDVVFEAALMWGQKFQDFPALPHHDPSYERVRKELDRINNSRVEIRSSTTDDFSRYTTDGHLGDYVELPFTQPDNLLRIETVGEYPYMCVTARTPNGDAKACIDFNRTQHNTFIRELNMGTRPSIVDSLKAAHPFMRKQSNAAGNAAVLPLCPVAKPAA